MRRMAVSLAAAALLGASPADAQTATVTADPVVAQPVACSEDTPAEVLQAARRHFGAGQVLVDSGAFREAEMELRAALRLYDSPNTHYLLGRALRGGNRYADAYAEFDLSIVLAARCSQADTARGAPNRYQQTVIRALRERDELTARVALAGVRFTGGTPAGANIAINATALPTDAAGRAFAYAPGELEVVVNAPGFAPFRTTRSVAAGHTTWIDVGLTRTGDGHAVGDSVASRTSGSIARPVGAAIGSAGAVAVIAGAAMYFVSRGQFDQLDSRCNPSCPLDVGYAAQVRDGETLQIAGIVTFWGGVGVMAAGAAMLIVSGRAPLRGPRTAMAWPSVDPFGRFVGFGAQF